MQETNAEPLPRNDRLYLQNGPIDIIAHVAAPEEIRLHLYSCAKNRFNTILDELVAELDLLRLPWSINNPVPQGSIALKMLAAVSDSQVFITPMAAVAGSVADEVLNTLLFEAKKEDSFLKHIQKMYVNNGGDIAFWLNQGSSYSLGVVDNTEIPELNTKVCLPYESPVRGIATSGWRGRSLSLGIADAVTVLAGSASIADVAATLIANDVNIKYQGIEKRPASEVKDDSDLGRIPVTVHVPPLPEEQTSTELHQGLRTARKFIKSGKIEAAYLSLQQQRLVIGNNLDEISNE